MISEIQGKMDTRLFAVMLENISVSLKETVSQHFQQNPISL
jgi:hypothetical protein